MSTAAFILSEATAAGIRIGTDGDELILCAPRGMPRQSWFSFEHAIIEHKDEIICLILAAERRRK
jgi:hypothetical protein